MKRNFAPLRKYLPFAPSLLLGVVGAVWLYFRPAEFDRHLALAASAAVGVGLAVALLACAWLLERTLPSFNYASRLLGRALGDIEISLPAAFTLAAATSVAEEVFFRGALLPLIGVWGQALVFALLHPAPLRAWSYTLFTFVAGLAFGYATVYTGGLWAPIVAHFIVNLHGFLGARSLRAEQLRRQRERSTTAAGDEAGVPQLQSEASGAPRRGPNEVSE